MLDAGSELGRYLIVGPLGSGGMGDVYRARDRTLRRDVAIKVLNVKRLAPELRDEFIARMINEARAAASLMHPNIVTIFDVNEQASMPYIVLELVDGVPLRSLARDTTVPLSTKLSWLGQIASGLAAAHRAGFVHRDVKPANVMIDRRGNAKLLDFGIAKRVANNRGGATLEGPASFATQDGSVLGTPRYMAPEQAAGAPSMRERTSMRGGLWRSSCSRRRPSSPTRHSRSSTTPCPACHSSSRERSSGRLRGRVPIVIRRWTISSLRSPRRMRRRVCRARSASPRPRR